MRDPFVTASETVIFTDSNGDQSSVTFSGGDDEGSFDIEGSWAQIETILLEALREVRYAMGGKPYWGNQE